MNVENILRENIITDCIRVPLIEMINKNADEFDKYLSMEISGTEDLKILNYHALKADSDKICLEIKADTSIFRKNYQKRTMNPEKRIQLFEDTVLEKLSSETNARFKRIAGSNKINVKMIDEREKKRYTDARSRARTGKKAVRQSNAAHRRRWERLQ